MFKGTILDVEQFNSKEGKPLTSYTVMFENNKVAKIMDNGMPKFKENDVAEFTVKAYGKYMQASVVFGK